MRQLKSGIETKYKMIRAAFRGLDKDSSNHLGKVYRHRLHLPTNLSPCVSSYTCF